MPFLAKCDRCGHIVDARTRSFLRTILMTDHNITSHKQTLDNPKRPLDLSNWTVSIISEEQFNFIQQAKKTKAYWQIIRMSAARLKAFLTSQPSLFSDGRRGEIKPTAILNEQRKAD
jgi:hypothetical protein